MSCTDIFQTGITPVNWDVSGRSYIYTGLNGPVDLVQYDDYVCNSVCRKLQKSMALYRKEIYIAREQLIQGQKYFTYEKIQIEIDLYNLFINTLEDEYKKNIVTLVKMVEGANNE